MSHLSHLKHIQQLELVGAKGLEVERIPLERKDGEWMDIHNPTYDWYFYLVDGKFVLNHPHTATFKQLQEDLLATQEIVIDETASLLERIACKAQMCSKLDDVMKSNQRLFMKGIDSTIIVKMDFVVYEHVSCEDIPEHLIVTSEWLHEGKLYWVTNMPYEIYPEKHTFNALKITDETPIGNWHVKLYLRDECFASLSFRIEQA